MSKKIILVLVNIVFLSGFNLAYAGVVINEVMYDLEGTDTGREWIEVYNDSSSAVDLSTYKFFEADTNHEIVAFGTESNISAHGYAVIALDLAKFKADWSGFSGIIFDSNFSLGNEGEALSIKDANLNIVDEYAYSSATGAQGDGKSLQKISGTWIASVPTPGISNQASASNEDDNTDNTNTDTNNDSSTSSSDNTNISSTSSGENKTSSVKKTIVASTIKAQITAKLLAYVGIPHTFTGMAFGLEGEQLFRGRYFWNFGDGDSREVKVINTDKFSHTYFYPGEYAVVLEYYPDSFADAPDASVEVTIKVVAPGVSISGVGNEKDFFVELSNDTAYDVDISKWVLFGNGKSFTLPKNTVIGPKRKMVVSAKLTNFSTADRNFLKLMTSQGEIAFDYSHSIVLATLVKTVAQSNKNFITTKSSEKDLTISTPEEQIPFENLSASAIYSETTTSKLVKSYLPATISFVFIGVSASAVYFIRKKKVVSRAGSDFDILDE